MLPRVYCSGSGAAPVATGVAHQSMVLDAARLSPLLQRMLPKDDTLSCFRLNNGEVQVCLCFPKAQCRFLHSGARRRQRSAARQRGVLIACGGGCALPPLPSETQATEQALPTLRRALAARADAVDGAPRAAASCSLPSYSRRPPPAITVAKHASAIAETEK